MAQRLSEILDAASVTSLVRQLARPPGAPRDPLDGVHAIHERARLFCGVLRVLAEDPFQPGHEMMALSLQQCATGELSRMLEWEALEFAEALVHARHHDDTRYGRADEFLARHQQIVSSVPVVVDLLDQMSRSEEPARPAEFAINALQFVDALESYLRWQDNVLLPLARRVLNGDQLASVVEALAERPDFADPEFRILSA